MAKAKKPSAEDIELFRRSVGPVRKISCDRFRPAHKLPPPRPRSYPEPVSTGKPDSFSDAYDPGSVSADETLFSHDPGCSSVNCSVSGADSCPAPPNSTCTA
jgi:hypothetical protein